MYFIDQNIYIFFEKRFQMILLTFYMIMNMRQMIHRKRKENEEKWITWNNVVKTYCLTNNKLMRLDGIFSNYSQLL